MRIDLTNLYAEALDMLKTWRNRYSKNEYPYKIAVNIFYRQYTMNSIWDCDLDNSFDEYKGVEIDILESFRILETVYANTSQKFIGGDILINLMNEKDDRGGLNYKDILPIVLRAQSGDNASVEEGSVI
ncbi:hypothetical protein [Mucilaginibacter sp.]|uniref:hypothetical protein n=1 Tax=Mucilaginibacter sp. TaxID=1882438 RepID=UPI00283D97DD|nr:hypothetical protein [Mucilaginibacter sp.]MDR3697347.1 hypothetical protein [Mucilaginibacter sp.]